VQLLQNTVLAVLVLLSKNAAKLRTVRCSRYCRDGVAEALTRINGSSALRREARPQKCACITAVDVARCTNTGQGMQRQAQPDARCSPAFAAAARALPCAKYVARSTFRANSAVSSLRGRGRGPTNRTSRNVPTHPSRLRMTTYGTLHQSTQLPVALQPKARLVLHLLWLTKWCRGRAWSEPAKADVSREQRYAPHLRSTASARKILNADVWSATSSASSRILASRPTRSARWDMTGPTISSISCTRNERGWCAD
jgi:hypothetical protein